MPATMTNAKTKHDVLTEEELARFPMRRQFVDTANAYAKRHSLEPSDVRILDFGCGRGRLAAKLLEHGFDAYGVDIATPPGVERPLSRPAPVVCC